MLNAIGAMLKATGTRMFNLGQGIYRAIPWTRLFLGLGSGWILLAIYQQFLAQLGSSNLVIAAAWCVTGVAWAWAWGRPPRAVRRPIRMSQATEIQYLGAWIRQLTVPCLVLLVVCVGPRVWMLHDGTLTDTMLNSPWQLFAYAVVWAVVLLGVPVWCIARLVLDSSEVNPDSARHNLPIVSPSTLSVLGVAGGLIVGLSINLGNLFTASILAAIVVLIVEAIRLRSSQGSSRDTSKDSGTSTRDWGADGGARLRTTSHNVPRSTSVTLAQALIAGACGGLLVWLTNVIGLLLVTTLFTFAAIVAGALAGMALGLKFSFASASQLRQRRLWATLSLVVTLLSMTAGFTFVVFRLVTLTGSISQVWMLQGLRDLFVAALTLPVGFVWGLCSGGQRSGIRVAESRTGAMGSDGSQIAERISQVTEEASPIGDLAPAWWLSQPGAGILFALAGGLLIQGGLIPACGLSMTAYGLLCLVSILTISEIIAFAELPRRPEPRGVLLASGLALLGAPFLSQGIRPEIASRLLFSTNVFLAEKSGVPRTQLPFLDDSRLELVQAGEHGMITVWKSAVSRFQIRENGIPFGILSTKGAIAPQASSEVLTSLIALTLHEDPRHVAMLGLGAGVPLFTCLGSLDISVTLVEPDVNLLSVLKRLTQNSDWDGIWNEERLRHLKVDPALWISGQGQQFDVVISNTDQSALLRSSSLFTQEFYRRASHRLTPDGIFCQRFMFHDFGPAPLQSISATIRSVFSNVMAVEIGPGEMAFIATNSPSGLIRPECVDRMQALYATAAMSGIGWDWSVLLTLGAYDAEHLDEIEATGRPRINSARNGRFSTQLPPEVMRWGNKPRELAAVLKPSTGKILNWLEKVSNRDDLLRRLAEVRAQQELLANYTDQYWAYRSQVRKQVSTRPMSLIQKVNHEKGKGGLHPEDKRRLRYFQQLSKAIHTKAPIEIARLETFTSPYDPLISLFVHQELAEIAARVPTSDPRLELEHRLHSLFFTTSNDRSVRNALSALRLILDKPESVPSGSDRFDMINTILQSLQYRWEARSTATAGIATDVSRDVEENIVLGEKALQMLTQLAPEAGISPADCEARKGVLERKLLQPLRTYRSRLEPHVARQRMKEREAVLDGGLPTDEELQFPGSEL